MLTKNHKLALAICLTSMLAMSGCSNSRSHIDQGLIYANQNDMQNAVIEFKAAVDKSPSVEGYSNLGAAYMKLGKYNLAYDALKRGERLDDDDPNLNYNLMALYSLRDQTDLALVHLEKALANGFANYDAIRFDPDLANLRGEPEFRTTLEAAGVFIQ